MTRYVPPLPRVHQLPGSQKVRVWQGELPELLARAVDHTATRIVPSPPSRLDGPRRAAVELIAHGAPERLYGLLGATFEPQATGHLVVAAPLSKDHAGNWLRWTFELSACPGLVEEYAGPVLEAGARAAPLLGAGVLSFERAAHSAAGSSPRVFGRLGAAVVRLLVHDGSALSTDELEGLLAG